MNAQPEDDLEVARAFVPALRGQFLNAFDTRNLVFDDLGNLGFDNFRGGPAIACFNGNNRGINIRILAYRQLQHRGQTEDNQQQ